MEGEEMRIEEVEEKERRRLKFKFEVLPCIQIFLGFCLLAICFLGLYFLAGLIK